MNSTSKNIYNSVEITPFKYNICSMVYDSLTQSTINYKILDTLFLIMYDFKCELSSKVLISRLNKIYKFINLRFNEDENIQENESFKIEM